MSVFCDMTQCILVYKHTKHFCCLTLQGSGHFGLKRLYLFTKLNGIPAQTTVICMLKAVGIPFFISPISLLYLPVDTNYTSLFTTLLNRSFLALIIGISKENHVQCKSNCVCYAQLSLVALIGETIKIAAFWDVTPGILV